MLTHLEIKNFKLLKDTRIELGQTVVFIGPNNSGKTTALQALALWYAGLQRLMVLRFPDDFEAEDRGEIYRILNRLDLTAIPVSSTNMLWHDLYVHNGDAVPLEIEVSGIGTSGAWSTALTFVYENEESLAVSLRRKNGATSILTQAALDVRLAFLPPMSGLVATEDRLERGSIQRRIGEGRTAEVLRNLCLQLYEANGKSGLWNRLTAQIRAMFGIELLPPLYNERSGLIQMEYRERSGITLDLSAAGRGMLQILLLLAYLYNNPGAVLLLDEPDAHLEIIRQREVYQLLTDVARQQGSQIIAATHSEVVLNEAGDRDMVIAFVGQPHRIDNNQRSQVAKSLKEIKFDDYYQAEQKGWVLYLEGATDLAILRAFAATLEHEAASHLEQPFVEYVFNQHTKAESHFHGLRVAKADMVGIALFDRLSPPVKSSGSLTEIMWRRREAENYLMLPAALEAYASHHYADSGRDLMRELIGDYVPPVALRDPNDAWWRNTKASDDFLDRLFEAFFKRLYLPNLLRKTDYHVLARFVPKAAIDPEVTEKLDAIVAVAKSAKPRKD